MVAGKMTLAYRGTKQHKLPKVSKATKAYVANALRNLPETKAYDRFADYFYCFATATPPIVLCDIPQTTSPTSSSRIGDQIEPLSLDIRLTFYSNVATATQTAWTNNVIRAVLIRWNMDTVPILNQVFQQTTNSALGITVNSPFVFEGHNQKQFTVFYDKRVSIGPWGPGGTVLHIKKKLRSKISFDAGVTTGSGLYYLVLISDDYTSSNVAPRVSYYSRFLYSDA